MNNRSKRAHIVFFSYETENLYDEEVDEQTYVIPSSSDDDDSEFQGFSFLLINSFLY